MDAWTLLSRAQAATARVLSAALLTQHGLSLNDYEALRALAVAPDRQLKRVDLARQLILTPSGVTRLLEGLERAGLVERATCRTDLRVTYARLTEAGLARLTEASCGHVGSIRSVLEQHLSSEEIRQLAALLAKLPGVVAGDDEAAECASDDAAACASDDAAARDGATYG